MPIGRPQSEIGTEQLEKRLSRLSHAQREQIAAQIQFHREAPPTEAVQVATATVNLVVIPGTTRPMSSKAMARWIATNPGWARGHTMLDMGCGTGMLGLVGLIAGAATCTFTDISEHAFASTRLNAARFMADGRAHVVKGDLFEGLSGAEKFSRIVFNHPYFGDDPLPEYPFTRGMLNSGELLERFLVEVRGFLAPGGELLMMKWSFAGETNDVARVGQPLGWRLRSVGAEDVKEGIQRGSVDVFILTL